MQLSEFCILLLFFSLQFFVPLTVLLHLWQPLYAYIYNFSQICYHLFTFWIHLSHFFKWWTCTFQIWALWSLVVTFDIATNTDLKIFQPPALKKERRFFSWIEMNFTWSNVAKLQRRGLRTVSINCNYLFSRITARILMKCRRINHVCTCTISCLYYCENIFQLAYQGWEIPVLYGTGLLLQISRYPRQVCHFNLKGTFQAWAHVC